MWEIPFLYRFLMTFRDSIPLPAFPIGDFEFSFIRDITSVDMHVLLLHVGAAKKPSANNLTALSRCYFSGPASKNDTTRCPLLQAIHILLLRRCLNKKGATRANFFDSLKSKITQEYDQMNLSDVFDAELDDSSNPVLSRTNYDDVHPKFKVLLLKILVDILLSQSDTLEQHIREMEDSSVLRWDPFAVDSTGKQFFCADDTFEGGCCRIYKQSASKEALSRSHPSKVRAKPKHYDQDAVRWELVCTSADEMRTLSKTYHGKGKRVDRLVANWLDEHVETLEECIKRRETKLLMAERFRHNRGINTSNIISYDGRATRQHKSVSYDYNRTFKELDEILREADASVASSRRSANANRISTRHGGSTASMSSAASSEQASTTTPSEEKTTNFTLEHMRFDSNTHDTTSEERGNESDDENESNDSDFVDHHSEDSETEDEDVQDSTTKRRRERSPNSETRPPLKRSRSQQLGEEETIDLTDPIWGFRRSERLQKHGNGSSSSSLDRLQQ